MDRGDIARGIGVNNKFYARNRGTLWREGVNEAGCFFKHPAVSLITVINQPFFQNFRSIKMSIVNILSNAVPRMLLVEDNLIAQRMIQVFVKSLGFELDIANNGAEAVALFEPGKYHTFWLDIGLPDFDGYEVTRRVRKMEEGTGYRVPIIAVSAHAPDDVELNMKVGIDAMLTKPLNTNKAKELLVQYGVI